MMRFIIRLFLLTLLVSCSTGNKYLTSYKDLSIYDVNDKVNELHIKSVSEKRYLTNNIGIDSVYINKIILNKELNLTHIFPDYEYRLISSQINVDTLSIFENKFCFQHLLKSKENVIRPKITNLFTFCENNSTNKYLIIVGIYEDDAEIRNLNWQLLFNITNPLNIVSVDSDYFNIFSSNVIAYNDYNKDDKIDIIYCIDNSICAFNIINDKLILIENIRINLLPEIDTFFYKIKNNSSWFFPLNRFPKNKKEFDFQYKKPIY